MNELNYWAHDLSKSYLPTRVFVQNFRGFFLVPLILTRSFFAQVQHWTLVIIVSSPGVLGDQQKLNLTKSKAKQTLNWIELIWQLKVNSYLWACLTLIS